MPLPTNISLKSRVPGQSRKYDLRYCPHCKRTQVHAMTPTTATCVGTDRSMGCGAITHLDWVRPMKRPTKLEDLLDSVLGLISEEADTPSAPKLEGEKKTSAKGAHRFDDGVKYVQMKYDDQFAHKSEYHTLKP